MRKILIVFGTRPEAIKMCPIIAELKRRKNSEVKILITGQHRSMLDGVLSDFGVTSDFDLSVMKSGQTLSDITADIIIGIQEVIRSVMPDLVLVHGDTASAFCTALCSFYMKIPICHIEAGLRTYDIKSPFPEEFYRRAISLISDIHFAPTELARENLVSEGVLEDRIFVTGNTVTDALRISLSGREEAEQNEKNERLIILTAHRRENIGEPMRRMFRAVARLLSEFDDLRVFYPVHENPAVRQIAIEEFSNCRNIELSLPLSVKKFHRMLANSYMILTDSGGIQEEAAYLGKPVLVMRDATERKEILSFGAIKLVGTDENNIFESARKLLINEEIYNRYAKPSKAYGDAFASNRIADVLENETILDKCGII